jgi:hypothetical protein
MNVDVMRQGLRFHPIASMKNVEDHYFAIGLTHGNMSFVVNGKGDEVGGKGMRVLLVLLLALAIVQQAIPAKAESGINGNALMDLCEADAQDAQSVCLGYIIGVADALGSVDI